MHKRVILLATASVLLAGCVSPKQSTSWEYKTISIPPTVSELDKELNRLIAEGWMLEKATFAFTPNTWASHYLLKRKKK